MMLEDVQSEGFGAATSGYDTVTVAGHDYPVKIDVSNSSTRVKQVTIAVAGVGDVGAVVYRTRLYKSKPLPDPVPVTP